MASNIPKNKLTEIKNVFDTLNGLAAFNARSAAEKQAVYTAVALQILNVGRIHDDQGYL